MTLTITLDTPTINSLDLSRVEKIIPQLLEAEKVTQWEQQLQFVIEYEREATDPRELSEIPEIRLWFIRLDTAYPWLPFFLDWKAGELARYTAMLVPHQFNRSEGIIYNPEGLEIFVMHKIFVLSNWLKQQQIPSNFRLKSMAQLWGYEIDDSWFDAL
ncbi:MAG: CRR6 family NdhI maturation factor [Xenococcaceae cyanobacterium MO_167.B52]|nr:CRR6 family NdhI maturation factor [Xenococcaceae cyanobacterium MO_167.B52]